MYREQVGCVPEGRLLHRSAREQSTDLAGRSVAVSSPQGRLGAVSVDGWTVAGAEVQGKHLLVPLRTPLRLFRGRRGLVHK